MSESVESFVGKKYKGTTSRECCKCSCDKDKDKKEEEGLPPPNMTPKQKTINIFKKDSFDEPPSVLMSSKQKKIRIREKGEKLEKDKKEKILEKSINVLPILSSTNQEKIKVKSDGQQLKKKKTRRTKCRLKLETELLVTS